MNQYYVYVYLDPRKKGNYEYKWFNFDYEPFYIGKGKGKRSVQHLKNYDLKNCGNKHKTNKIKKLLNEGLQPLILNIRNNLTHSSSCRLEKLLIKTIGRYDLKKGPLVNMTDGGEGTYNRKCSDYTKNIMSNKMKGKIAWNKGLTKETDNRVKEYADKNIGNKYSDDSKAKMSKSAKKRANTKEWKEWFNKHNPSYNKEIMRKRSEAVKQSGIYKNEKNPRWIDININDIITLYNNGMIINNIAKKYNVGRGTITRRLKMNNVIIYRGKRIYKYS